MSDVHEADAPHHVRIHNRAFRSPLIPSYAPGYQCEHLPTDPLVPRLWAREIDSLHQLGTAPRIMSEEQIRELSADIVPTIPDVVNAVLSKIALESVRRQAHLTAEIALLKEEQQRLRAEVVQLSTVQEECSALRSQLASLTTVVDALRRPRVEDIVNRAHRKHGYGVDDQMLSEIAEKRARNLSGLSHEDIVQQVKDVVRSEIENAPHHGDDY
jgi:hypothetical protein